MTDDGIIPVERHGRMLFYVPSQVVAALNRYGRFQEQKRKKRWAAKIEANQNNQQSKEVDDQTSRAEA